MEVKKILWLENVVIVVIKNVIVVEQNKLEAKKDTVVNVIEIM